MEIRTFNSEDFETVYKMDEKTGEQATTEQAKSGYLSPADLEGRISSIQQMQNKANEHKRLYFIKDFDDMTREGLLQGPFSSPPSVNKPKTHGHYKDAVQVTISICCFPLELYSLTGVYFGYGIRPETYYIRESEQYMENAFMASLKSLELPKETRILESKDREYTVLSNNCGIFFGGWGCEIIGFDGNDVKEIGENLNNGAGSFFLNAATQSQAMINYYRKGKKLVGNPLMDPNCYINKMAGTGFAYNVHLEKGMATADTYKSMKTILSWDFASMTDVSDP